MCKDYNIIASVTNLIYTSVIAQNRIAVFFFFSNNYFYTKYRINARP